MSSWLYSCFCEKSAHGHHGTFVRFFLWMGTMKHGTDTIEGKPYSGSSPLTDFRSACAQQTLNIAPRDIGAYRVLENSV
jgi:hypothetical protein